MRDEFEGLLLVHTGAGTKVVGKVAPMRLTLGDGRVLEGGHLEVDLAPRSCRVCGCTDERACRGGCWWVEGDLCSACRAPKGR